MKQVDLFNYLPEYISGYREIEEILKLENTQLSELWKVIEQAYLNGFIFNTDEDGIRIFEKMVKVYPKKGDTLKDRQTRVYAKWNATLPYTWEWLEGYLKSFFTNTDKEVYPLLFNNEYKLDVRMENSQYGELEKELYPQLRELIPANLVLRVINKFPSQKTNLYNNAYVSSKMTREIMNKISYAMHVGNLNLNTYNTCKMKRFIYATTYDLNLETEFLSAGYISKKDRRRLL